MPKTPKGKSRGRPPGRTPTTTVFARVPPELGRALDDYLEALRPKPTLTSVVQVALQDYLERLGYWPPARPEGP